MFKSKLSVKRLSQIVNALFNLGFFSILTKLEINKYLPFHKRINNLNSNNISPNDLRLILENLGGAFIKLGQLLALRSDLIGIKYSSALEKLLDETEVEDFNDFENLVKDLKEISINKKAIGSASISQVYKGKFNGKNVAIKLKKPNVDKLFEEDIKIMEYFAPIIQEKFSLDFIDMIDIINEFKIYTNKELNFENEAHNMKIFHNNFKDSKEIIIPKVYDEFTTKDRIVMEFYEGESILKIKNKNKKYINIISNSVYKMIFEDRVFHADLHSGNILFHEGKIIYLDFGIVGRIDDELRDKLFDLFSSLVNSDSRGTCDALVELHIGNEEVNEEVLKNGISEVLGPSYNLKLSELDFSAMFNGTIEVARKSKIKMPGNLILFGKSLITMEGFCEKIDPSFNVVTEAKPYVKKIIKEKMSINNIKKESSNNIKSYYSLFSKIPKKVSDFSKKFNIIEKQIIDIDENISEFKYLFRNMTKIFVMTIVFFSLFIGAVLLVDKEPLFFNYSFISIFLFVICCYLVLKIHKNLEKIF